MSKWPSQRNSQVVEFIELPNCLQFPPPQRTQQLPDYEDWVAQQAAPRPRSTSTSASIDVQSITNQANILFNSGNYQETWVLLGKYWEGIDHLPMAWAMIMSCGLALGESKFAYDLSGEAVRLFGTHHQILSLAASTSAAVGNKNEYLTRLNLLKKFNPQMAKDTDEMCRQLYMI